MVQDEARSQRQRKRQQHGSDGGLDDMSLLIFEERAWQGENVRTVGILALAFRVYTPLHHS